MWEIQQFSLFRLCNIDKIENLPKIWKTIIPLTKEKARMVIEIMCVHKTRELRYKAPRISHAVEVLIINLKFHTEYPDGFGDTVKMFLFPNLSLSEISEASLVARLWDTALDSSIITTYSNTSALIQCHKVAPIVVWDAANSMLGKWAVFLTVLCIPPRKHCAVYKLMLLVDVSVGVNSWL